MKRLLKVLPALLVAGLAIVAIRFLFTELQHFKLAELRTTLRSL